MLVTKQELEEIWQTKPYGYMKQFVKDIKGRNKFTVTCICTKQEEIGRESITVYSKTKDKAIDSVRYSLPATLRTKYNIPNWDSNFQYRYFVE